MSVYIRVTPLSIIKACTIGCNEMYPSIMAELPRFPRYTVPGLLGRTGRIYCLLALYPEEGCNSFIQNFGILYLISMKMEAAAY
jgi:hypothetical protein